MCCTGHGTCPRPSDNDHPNLRTFKRSQLSAHHLYIQCKQERYPATGTSKSKQSPCWVHSRKKRQWKSTTRHTCPTSPACPPSHNTSISINFRLGKTTGTKPKTGTHAHHTARFTNADIKYTFLVLQKALNQRQTLLIVASATLQTPKYKNMCKSDEFSHHERSPHDPLFAPRYSRRTTQMLQFSTSMNTL